MQLVTITFFTANDNDISGSRNSFTADSEALRDELRFIADNIENLSLGERIVIERTEG